MVELVKANDIFTEAKCLLEGKNVDGTPGPKDLRKAENLLNELLTNNVGNPMVLYVLGSLYMECGHFGLAIQLLSQVAQREPQFGEAWNNLGLAYRGANDFDRAIIACKKAVKYLDFADIPCNLSGLYINRGTPAEALQYANQALEKDPDHTKAKWHKAIALLEMGRWDEAWDLHDVRLEGGANYNIANRNYHGDEWSTLWWDGKTGSSAEKTCRRVRVAIHGEQGMGDEIMFASCLPDAIATGADIIFEPSPRFQGLFERSFPGVTVFGTDGVDGKGWIEDRGPPDFKCAIGSLPKFYRRKTEDFPGTPYLIPCPEKKQFWEAGLYALGSKPRIGLTWQGGVQSTRVEARSFHPRILAKLFRHDVQWVSLQYDVTAAANVADIRNEFGVEIEHWPEAVEAVVDGKPSNMDDLTALVSCLDLVISVPQTAYHVAGALGIPCWVMTPSEPDWRLGVEGDTLPWYRSVKLIRQQTRDWTPVIDEIDRRLGAMLERKAA